MGDGFRGVGQHDGPIVASGGAWFRVVRGLGGRWSGPCREGADAGQDLGEQGLAGWQAQDQRTRVVNEAGGDADQPVPQGRDHGLAVPDTVPDQAAVGGGGGGESWCSQPVRPAASSAPHIHARLTSG